MRELFIYYRVDAAHADAASDAVHAMQTRLKQQHPALSARLMRRVDEAGDRQTWMETYAAADPASPSGVTPALQAAIEVEAAALSALLASVRHTEVFTSMVESTPY